jgi:hypothetical protein
MAAQILLSVDKKNLTVAPGANVSLAVTVQNLTTLLDQVAVRADGIDVAWVEVLPPYLPVFAQGEATARIVIQPPREPARAVAGRYPLRVRGTSQEFPGQESEAESQLQVQLVGDYRFWLDRETRDGQEAVFPLKVQNSSNAPLRLQFKGSDDQGALWFKFDPFQLEVPAGEVSSAMLTLKAKRTAPEARTLIFSLTAQGEYVLRDENPVAAPTHHISGEFVQGAPARLTISIDPLQVQGRESGSYSLRVGNPGAAPATVELIGSGDNSVLAFDFEPARVDLAPQSEATVSLTVRPRSVASTPLPEQHVFKVTARPLEGQAASVSSEATFVRLGAETTPRATPFPWLVVLAVLLLVFLAAIVLVMVVIPSLLR